MTREHYRTNLHPIAVVTIREDETITEAARKMRSNDVGCLIVTDNCGKLVGIITERDISSRAAANLLDLEKEQVCKIMTKDVIWCSPDTEPRKARELMAANHIRHLPVVKDGKAIRMYSLRDIVQEQLIEGRLAAEQVAMLSACLKSSSLYEITNMVAKESPKLFDAKRAIIYFQEDCVEPNQALPACYNNCVCPRQCLADMFKDENDQEGYRICTDSMPIICQQDGALLPRIVIQLKIDKIKGILPKGVGSLKGILCMCGIEHAKAVNQTLLYYKAKLVKDILNVHLSNVAQYQDARIASLTDSLTKVGSRQYFEDMLESESSRAGRYGRDFSVAIVDIDNFKDFNDRFGHIAGDFALKQLAECMKNQKRSSDTLARFGGDEFVIVLPETNAQDAVKMLERLQKNVCQIKVGDNAFLTISCGVAQASAGQTISGTELIRRADIALYKAKDDGRDCIRIWNEDADKPLEKNQITQSASTVRQNDEMESTPQDNLSCRP